MKKSFLFGFVVAFILFLLGILTRNTHLFGSISMGIGIVFFAIGGLAGGVFVSGDQFRSNHYTESREDRTKRTNTFLGSGVIAFPHLVVGVILFMI